MANHDWNEMWPCVHFSEVNPVKKGEQGGHKMSISSCLALTSDYWLVLGPGTLLLSEADLASTRKARFCDVYLCMFKEQQDTGSWRNLEGNVYWAWNGPNAIRVILWQLLLGCCLVFWCCQHNCCEDFFKILLSPSPISHCNCILPWEPTNIMKNHNIEKHRQRSLGPNNRIISDGTVCHIGIFSLWKKDHRFRITTKWPMIQSNHDFFQFCYGIGVVSTFLASKLSMMSSLM